MANNVDKIAVSEELERLEATRTHMEAGVRAGKALLWFEEYANKPAKDVLKLTVAPVASSTPNADIAAKYLEQAVGNFAEQILEAAIASAQASFRGAENARRARR